MSVVLDPRRTIIFDTSGINELLDDMESAAITRSLSVAYRIRVTQSNVIEVAATSDPERRESLVRLCRELQYRGECVYPSNWVITELAKLHSRQPSRFNWRDLDIRFRELEDELARREILTGNEIAREIRLDNRSTNKLFLEIYRDARKQFGNYSQGERPDWGSLIRMLKADDGGFWLLSMDVYRRATSREASLDQIKSFVYNCPPFHALMLTSAIAQYEYCIRLDTDPSTFKAGRLDLFMGTYLPYCERFVTQDPGQASALGAIAEEASIQVAILAYAELRDLLFAGL